MLRWAVYAVAPAPLAEEVNKGGNSGSRHFYRCPMKHNFNKLLWGEGPWINEPDEDNWVDEATGLRCRVLRSPEIGHLNGYCGVPPAHPAYELHYDGGNWLDAEKHYAAFHKLIRKHYSKGLPGLADLSGVPEVETVPGIGEMLQEVRVHGGLTFAGRFKEDDVWWFGFDCAHVGDLCPGMEYTKRLAGIKPFGIERLIPRDKYRTLEYVKAECTSLARQLHEMDVKSRVTLGGTDADNNGRKA